jgi:surface carbohydrate biosynthesis protein (TIGR04326 family)
LVFDKQISGMILSKDTLILLDRVVGEKECDGIVVSWSDMVVSSGIVSLPVKTEEQAISLKEEFIRWLYEFGKSEVGDRSMVSHFKIFDNLSFWWLTSVAEKSPFLCGSIFEVFKLRTLEKIYSDNHCQDLVYNGSSVPLHSVLKKWSLELGHSYKWIPSLDDSSVRAEDSFRKKLIRKLPHLLRAIAWIIKKWLDRWWHVNSIQLDTEESSQTPRPTIVTFFPNVHLDEMEKGNFRSKYWEGLHDYLEIKKIPVDWVWIYFGSNDFSFEESVKLKDECNRNSNNQQRYFLLEEFLGRGDLWKIFFLYLKVRRKAYGLQNLRKEFYLSDSKINFFPIMKDDWNHSFFGVGAVEKILWAIMFDSMAQKIPASPWGLYTWENQTWERALVSAWKRHNPNSKVFGYEHSSVRLMDLRLFSDPRSYLEKGVEEFPIPDMLGVNSSTGLNWIRNSKYPSSKTTRIEALRYFHLNGKHGCFRKPIASSNRKLLLVAGIIPEEVLFQIRLLKQADKEGGLGRYDEVWIKPHPGLNLEPILNNIKPNFKFTIVARPIIELMGQADVVYCANSTGASLEAAWLGVPLIILAAIDSMNLNPLFGFPGQSFVKDCPGLLSALENPKPVEMSKDYFYLDENLKSWENLVGYTESTEQL